MNTVKSFFEFATHFGFKKFVALLCLLSVCFVAVWVFEAQTGHFSLSSTSSKVSILTDLVELRTEHKLTLEEEALRLNLLYSLSESSTSWVSAFKYSFDGIRFIAGMSTWIVFAIGFLFTKEKEKVAGAFVCLLFGVFFGLAACVFTFDSLWMTWFIIPWGLVVLFILFIVALAFLIQDKDGSDKEQKKAETNKNIDN